MAPSAACRARGARSQDTTGCKIFIRGRDIGDKWQSEEEAAMPQHVHIEAAHSPPATRMCRVCESPHWDGKVEATTRRVLVGQ